MPDEILALPLLGQRSYLQGTTLVERLEPRLAGASGVCFRIKRIMSTDRVILREAPDGDDPAAVLSWSLAGTGRELHVHPLDPSPQPRREEFDESLVVGKASISGESIRFTGPSPYSWIRSAVALKKALLTALFQPTSAGQWLFTRMDIDAVPGGFERMEVAYRSRFGFAAVSSILAVDGVELGTLQFSWLAR